METLFIWDTSSNLYRPLKFEVFDVIEGVEHAAEKMGRVNKRL
jgi:hypothetical protein